MTLLQMVIYIHMNRRVSAGSPSLFGLCHNLKTCSVDVVLNSSLENVLDLRTMKGYYRILSILQYTKNFIGTKILHDNNLLVQLVK